MEWLGRMLGLMTRAAHERELRRVEAEHYGAGWALAMHDRVAALEKVAADWKSLAQEAMADNRELRARLLPPLPGERTTDPGEKRTTRDADTKAAEGMKAAKQVVRR